eukprot:TRINITY_DN3294_c2_g1_i1.p1 TRINITY_DN3294_c2_g1~~TRINITY_DN3294_c2_g1_i1.p1  ORF type:complete len:327 (+),score=100.30 TRINITY_DN3294_c2_g1_i1:409-1389(+)
MNQSKSEVTVYDTSLLDSLMEENEEKKLNLNFTQPKTEEVKSKINTFRKPHEQRTKLKKHRNNIKANYSIVSPAVEKKPIDPRRMSKHLQQTEKWDKEHDKIKNLVEEKKNQNEARDWENIKNLHHREETFVKELNNMLLNYDEMDRESQIRLYEEWVEKVYLPLQNELLKTVDMNFEKSFSKKRQLFDEYLRIVNVKSANGGQIFRDIVIQSEYDPFNWENTTVAVDVKNDPIHQGVNKTKTNKLQARKIMDYKVWAQMESTPFYDRPIKTNTRDTLTKNTMKIDDFDLGDTNEHLQKEMGRFQKRMVGTKFDSRNLLIPNVDSP